jgi:LmbE family N-acetylglucosaminyl deacetylase
VFFPAPLELHPDHRMTARLVWSALQQASTCGAPAAAYAYEVSVQSPINLLIDISAQRAMKEQVMAVYISQNEQNGYPELVLALNRARTFTLPAEVEFAEGFCHYPAEALQISLREATQALLDLYW